ESRPRRGGGRSLQAEERSSGVERRFAAVAEFVRRDQGVDDFLGSPVRGRAAGRGGGPSAGAGGRGVSRRGAFADVHAGGGTRTVGGRVIVAAGARPRV